MIVRADNVQMGELACEEMGKRVAADAVVVTLDGDPVTSNGRDRTNGFNDCMASKYPGVKLVNVATEWDPAKAASGIETALNQYGNVAGWASLVPAKLGTTDPLIQRLLLGEITSEEIGIELDALLEEIRNGG